MEINYASPSFSDLPAASASMPSPATTTSTAPTGRPVRIIPLQHPTVTSSSSSSSSSSSPFPFSRWAMKVRRMTWLEWIEFFLPCYRWIRIYKWREYFQVDLMAGITVGVMLVPQVTSTCLVSEKTEEN